MAPVVRMTTRTAGATVYLQEELSNARLQCEELKGFVTKALDLINKSEKKDHFYAIAGELIHSIPSTIIGLEKSLGAVAMVVNKTDYEQLRQVIDPTEVDKLEALLEDVRLRMPRRRG